MRYHRQLIALFLILLPCKEIHSQFISASSPLTGCDSLMVNFEILPSDVYDTVSVISWDFGDGTTLAGENSPGHLFSSPGAYTVSVRLNSSTTLNLADPVVVYPLPESGFFTSDSVSLGNYVWYLSSPEQEWDTLSYSYEWEVDQNLVSSSPSIMYDFTEPGLYAVTLSVQHNRGCSSATERSLNITDILDVPNVFTPNLDGFNDFFTVRTNGVNQYEFSVYSKSGVLVYKSASATISWDGRTLSGVELQPGLYYYVIRQVDGNSPETRNGFIQLLK